MYAPRPPQLGTSSGSHAVDSAHIARAYCAWFPTVRIHSQWPAAPMFLSFSIRVLLLALALAPIAALLSACTRGNDSEELLVFVAASMADAAEEVGERFQHSAGVRVAFNFGASQSLARQASEGAPADVIITAGRFPMEFLSKNGNIAYGPVELLSNELVVVTRQDGGEVDALEDLLGPRFDVVALGDPELAPAGRYAKESLQNAGFWEAVRPKAVWGGDVRAALAYVETGSADAAIVYRTDALIADGLLVSEVVPPSSYGPIEYPAAVLASAPLPDQAREFIDFLSGNEALQVFREYGFIVLE